MNKVDPLIATIDFSIGVLEPVM